MVWLLIIPLIILWAIIQNSIIDSTGRYPRSRGSLRYQRRRARKLDLVPEDYPINPRLRQSEPYRFSRKTNFILLGITIAIWVALLFPYDRL